MQTKPRIKIYRDNQLSLTETYAPIVKRNIITGLKALDYFIAKNKWPESLDEL